MTELLERISQAVYDGDSELASQLADEAIAAGLDAETVINKGGVTAMDRLGEDFDNLEVFLPELVMGGDAMKALIEKMTANLKGEGGFAGTVVIGCAKGDLHDIGKNLVGTQLAVNGFKVYDRDGRKRKPYVVRHSGCRRHHRGATLLTTSGIIRRS